MAEFNKYEAEKMSRELKSILDEAVKSKEENDQLKKKIVEIEKNHATEIANLKKQ